MIQRLMDAIREKKAPVVVGLDPSLSFLPKSLLCGESEKEIADAFYAFNRELIDATCDLVPAVKPQIAMYEAYGTEGLKAYEKTIRYAQDKGLIVIGDIKRGDIGSTSEAYAKAHLGDAFHADIVTVNPYLGSDGIDPFIDVCNQRDKGIFVLVKTSNKSGAELQDQTLQDGRKVYELMADLVSAWGEKSMDGAYSNVGAVVGATWPEEAGLLRARMPHTFVLAPGYGAQGATAKDLSGFFDGNREGVIINSSRGIIAAYKKEEYVAFGEARFAEAAREATIAMITEIRDVMKGL
ncbi:MAG: orotidine-5'-phosphate decarboxylase [Lachnospiraceae bacterium]|nr:orotidine-5'-phosphate decarboxylase [Lachnospiraceae bacterium]